MHITDIQSCIQNVAGGKARSFDKN